MHSISGRSLYAIFGRTIDIAIEPVGERQSII
jgi:hypothetical protein